MTISKPLAVASLMVAVAGMVVAAPTVRIQSGGAKSGQKGAVVIMGVPNGSSITGAVLNVQFDDAKVAVAQADVTPGAGWTINDRAVAGNVLSLAMANTDGQTTDGPIATFQATQNGTGIAGSSALTLLDTSNIADDQFNQYTVGPLSAAFTTGPTKNLGGTISGAVSVGVAADNSRVVAAVVNTGAGTNLRLLNALTLDDLGTAAVPGPTSGRPGFGFIGGNAVVAVGTDEGSLAVFNAADGAAVGAPVTLGTKVTTPAIDSATGDIYVAVEVSGGAPEVHKVAAGASAGSAPLTGATVGAAPAFVAGGIAVGSDTTLAMFRVAGSVFTPQATITGSGFTAPVLAGDGRGLATTSDGNVFQFNVTTGSVAANSLAAPAGAAPFSQGFPVPGGAIYGGNNGSVYQFNLGPDGPVAGTVTPLGANPIGAAPIQLGGSIYALTTTGTLLSGDGSVNLPLGAPATSALAATGSTAGTDSLIVATTDGTVASLPL